MTLKLLSLSYVERLCATITACYNIYFIVRKRNFNKKNLFENTRQYI